MWKEYRWPMGRNGIRIPFMKRIFSIILSVVLMTILLSACEKTKTDATKDISSQITAQNNNSASTKSSASKLSFENFNISIDGRKLSFPFKWSDIKDTAYSYYTDMPDIIQYKKHIEYYWKSRNRCGNKVDIELKNSSSSDLVSPDNCDVVYIYMHTIIDDQNKVDFVLPDGVTFGDEYKDIVKLYGEPSDITKAGDEIRDIQYQSNDNKFKLGLSFYKNKLSGCCLYYN